MNRLVGFGFLTRKGIGGIAFHGNGDPGSRDPDESKANFVHPSDPRPPGLL